MSKDKSVSFATTRHVHDHCLCFATQRAARALARRFDEVLRPVGLTSGQFSLLMSLNQPEPPSVGSIAALLGMDRTTLTANLKPLERQGLVETAVDPADRPGPAAGADDGGPQAAEGGAADLATHARGSRAARAIRRGKPARRLAGLVVASLEQPRSHAA